MEIKLRAMRVLWRCTLPPGGHQRAVDAGGWGAEVAVEGAAPGVSVSGRVARWAAAGPEGRYSGPRWPQPAMAAALAARTTVLTRIWDAFNMRKL
jgi:hypothetical protein